MKKIKTEPPWIRDLHSEYGSRIQIPEAAEYGPNADPDPKHWNPDFGNAACDLTNLH